MRTTPNLDDAATQGAPRIRVGVSACLLGDEVRFDGGHKRDRYVTDTLGAYFEWVKVCPEAESGLGTPRPPVRLVQIGEGLRVLGVRDASLDVTEVLEGFHGRVRDRLAGVRGFILKRASPSCGMERVKVFDERGVRVGAGRGVFAEALMTAEPALPVEEEGRLLDARLRENFVTRVFAYDRWLGFLGAGPDVAALQQFHASHKLLLMAHNQAAYRRLGRLVADTRPGSLRSTLPVYGLELMGALAKPAPPPRHANVLQHVAGYLKRDLDAGDRAELGEVIDQYRLGRVPLVVPLTLLRHHLRRHPKPYLEGQHYLRPHPDELMLRNHV